MTAYYICDECDGYMKYKPGMTVKQDCARCGERMWLEWDEWDMVQHNPDPEPDEREEEDDAD
ncbi:MAG: hypothetical protein GY851_07315 [bacterium]|nr:hypothetical protein [bacterium]